MFLLQVLRVFVRLAMSLLVADSYEGGALFCLLLTRKKSHVYERCLLHVEGQWFSHAITIYILFFLSYLVGADSV